MNKAILEIDDCRECKYICKTRSDDYDCVYADKYRELILQVLETGTILIPDWCPLLKKATPNINLDKVYNLQYSEGDIIIINVKERLEEEDIKLFEKMLKDIKNTVKIKVISGVEIPSIHILSPSNREEDDQDDTTIDLIGGKTIDIEKGEKE